MLTISFQNTCLVDLDVIIGGLRLMRRGSYDNEIRERANELLCQALEVKRSAIRKPEVA